MGIIPKDKLVRLNRQKNIEKQEKAFHACKRKNIEQKEKTFLMSKGKDRAQKENAIVSVSEIYLDGKLKEADLISEDEKSYGIFMHSLILSNYAEVMKINSNKVNVIGNEYEKAIFYYTASKGFDKSLIEGIAPKVSELSFEYDHELRVSTHLINDKMRIISKGTPEELLKRCPYILLDSKFVRMTRRFFREVNHVLLGMVGRCQNVYAIAIKDISQISKAINIDTYVDDMTLVALVGIG